MTVMRRWALITAFALWAVAPLCLGTELTAKQIMQRNFLATKISAFTGDVTMKLINSSGGKRVRRIKIWSKLKPDGVDSKVLIRFTYPPDVRDTGFLQIQNAGSDDDMWIYLPALSKTRRLVSSEKSDSFFGTDFTYGDILAPAVDKFHHRRLPNAAIDGKEYYVIESTPVDAETRDDMGFSRKVSWIDMKNFVERKVDFYDAQNQLFKVETVFDPKLVEPKLGRWVAMRREMLNVQTNHRTVYKFNRFQIESHLSDRLFSVRMLARE